MSKMYVIPNILYAKQAKEEKIRAEKNWMAARSMPGRGVEKEERENNP